MQDLLFMQDMVIYGFLNTTPVNNRGVRADPNCRAICLLRVMA